MLVVVFAVRPQVTIQLPRLSGRRLRAVRRGPVWAATHGPFAASLDWRRLRRVWRVANGTNRGHGVNTENDRGLRKSCERRRHHDTRVALLRETDEKKNQNTMSPARVSPKLWLVSICRRRRRRRRARWRGNATRTQHVRDVRSWNADCRLPDAERRRRRRALCRARGGARRKPLNRQKPTAGDRRRTTIAGRIRLIILSSCYYLLLFIIRISYTHRRRFPPSSALGFFCWSATGE